MTLTVSPECQAKMSAMSAGTSGAGSTAASVRPGGSRWSAARLPAPGMSNATARMAIAGPATRNAPRRLVIESPRAATPPDVYHSNRRAPAEDRNCFQGKSCAPIGHGRGAVRHMAATLTFLPALALSLQPQADAVQQPPPPPEAAMPEADAAPP